MVSEPVQSACVGCWSQVVMGRRVIHRPSDRGGCQATLVALLALGLAAWSVMVDIAARHDVSPGTLGLVTLTGSLTPMGLEGGASGAPPAEEHAPGGQWVDQRHPGGQGCQWVDQRHSGGQGCQDKAS